LQKKSARVGEKVYQCSELVKLFNTSQAKIKRKNHPKKGKNKIKHDQTEAATKQIYVFGLRKKIKQPGKAKGNACKRVLGSLES